MPPPLACAGVNSYKAVADVEAGRVAARVVFEP